jgi:hypothetical protein
MLKKTISAELPQETEDTVIQDLSGVNDALPFMVELTKDERSRLFKMSRKKLDFMERGLRYAQENPELVPAYLDLTEFEKDVALRSQLYRIFDKVNSLRKNLKDTLTVLEAEVYETCRIFYAAVKVAAKRGEEGSEHIAKDLLYHYKRSSENGSAPEEPGNTEAQTTQTG